MLQEELPCLIDGCDWKGRHLSIHLNAAHGVRADDFKRAAGFNINTGLVNRELFEQLSKRPIHVDHLGEFPLPSTKGAVFNYQSLEGREHRMKTRLESGVGPERICRGCGKEFTQSSIYGRALYCSIPCREKDYRRIAKINSHSHSKCTRENTNQMKMHYKGKIALTGIVNAMVSGKVQP
jgi:hypothetical protein